MVCGQTRVAPIDIRGADLSESVAFSTKPSPQMEGDRLSEIVHGRCKHGSQIGCRTHWGVSVEAATAALETIVVAAVEGTTGQAYSPAWVAEAIKHMDVHADGGCLNLVHGGHPPCCLEPMPTHKGGTSYCIASVYTLHLDPVNLIVNWVARLPPAKSVLSWQVHRVPIDGYRPVRPRRDHPIVSASCSGNLRCIVAGW